MNSRKTTKYDTYLTEFLFVPPPSCNIIDRINEVTLRSARLVLRWVTICRHTI